MRNFSISLFLSRIISFLSVLNKKPLGCFFALRRPLNKISMIFWLPEGVAVCTGVILEAGAARGLPKPRSYIQDYMVPSGRAAANWAHNCRVSCRLGGFLETLGQGRQQEMTATGPCPGANGKKSVKFLRKQGLEERGMSEEERKQLERICCTRGRRGAAGKHIWD